MDMGNMQDMGNMVTEKNTAMDMVTGKKNDNKIE